MQKMIYNHHNIYLFYEHQINIQDVKINQDYKN